MKSAEGAEDRFRRRNDCTPEKKGIFEAGPQRGVVLATLREWVACCVNCLGGDSQVQWCGTSCKRPGGAEGGERRETLRERRSAGINGHEGHYVEGRVVGPRWQKQAEAAALADREEILRVIGGGGSYAFASQLGWTRLAGRRGGNLLGSSGLSCRGLAVTWLLAPPGFVGRDGATAASPAGDWKRSCMGKRSVIFSLLVTKQTGQHRGIAPC